MTSRNRRLTAKKAGHAVVGCGLALLAGVAASAAEPAARDATDLAIVDCLLPPKVQKLGGRLTYLTPRRPAKLVARDCEIKGGEYTAFDRANYEDALKVWMEAARSGDAEAQTAVGEIYEKGLGRAPDYAEAATWYARAAEQGDTRAMLGLAYLHEQGLGVEKDELKAVNFYRQATGIVDDDLVYESDLIAARAEAQRVVDALAVQLEQQNKAVESLQSKLALTQQRLQQRRAALISAEALAAELREQVDQIKDGGVSTAERARFDAEVAELRAQEEKLARRNREIAELEETLANQRGQLTEQFQQASTRDTELEDRLYAQDQETRSLREELSAVKNELYEKDRQLSELASSMAAERLQLASTKEQSFQQRDELTRKQQQEIELRERRIADQEAKIAQLRQQQNNSLRMLTELRERERELIAERESQNEALVSSRDEEMSKLRARLAAARDAVFERDTLLAELKSTIEAERLRVNAEKERTSALTLKQQRDIELREGKIAEQEARIAELQNEQNRSRVALDELRERERELALQSESQRAEIASSRAELARAKQRSLETEQRLMELTARLDEERARFALETEQLTRREEQASSSQQQEVDALRAKLKIRETRIVEQEGVISALREQHQSLADRVIELESRPAPITVATRSIERGTRPTERIAPTRGIARQFGLGEFHALIIGNNDYQYLEDLKTPVNDAAAIEDVLRSRYGFKTRVLQDATNLEIMAALNEYKGMLGEDDSLLIYYAGHGELNDESEGGHWLPVDAEPGNTANWIPDEQISQYVGVMKAKHVLVIADSCYSGAMTRNSSYRVKRKNASGDVDFNLLGALAGMKSRTVMTSGGEKPVIDDVGGPHSIFAEQLIRILDNNDRILDDESLYGDLFDGVTQRAAQFEQEQSPQYSQIHGAGHGQGLFLFIPTSS